MIEQKLEVEKIKKRLSSYGKINLTSFDFPLKGFEYIGQGISRIVFLHKSKKYVVKIEKRLSRKYYRQNKKEWKNYKKIPKYLRKYFVKPLAHGDNYGWLLMQKVDTSIDVLKKCDIANKLQSLLEENNFYMTDCHGANVGILNGEPVIFDYGLYEFPQITN